MKVAVATDDKEHVSLHFGRAQGFMVFNIEGNTIKECEYRENFGKSQGFCGSCDHQKMIENIKDCDTVISHGMGQRIYDDLTKHGIKAFITEEEIVYKAINKFINQKLVNRLDKLH